MKVKYLLSDLDDVIRKFPPQRDKEIEEKFNLPLGSLFNTALEKTILHKAVCGTITDESWRTEITKNISKICDDQTANQAVNEWSDFPGDVDYKYLDYVEAFFSKDSVALLSNGNSRLKSDLIKLEIESRFFKIFNSAEIGICKPDKQIYENVINNLGCLPAEILFVDDSLSHIEAASAVGLRTYHYKSLQPFQKYLTEMVENNWQPMLVTELAEVFSKFKPHWRIAGGWAIDLFLGKQTRTHSDLDILIERNDQAALQTLLSDWDVWVSDPPGTLRPWIAGEFLNKGIQDIWCRRNLNDPWRFQVMLFDVEDGDWIFKRDEAIRRSLKSVTLGTNEGFSILAPEVQLLYKSKSLRDKDMLDFENTLTALNTAQKRWLKEALIKVYGDKHEWIKRL